VSATLEFAREKGELQRAYYSILHAISHHGLAPLLLSCPGAVGELVLGALTRGAATHVDPGVRKLCLQVRKGARGWRAAAGQWFGIALQSPALACSGFAGGGRVTGRVACLHVCHDQGFTTQCSPAECVWCRLCRHLLACTGLKITSPGAAGASLCAPAHEMGIESYLCYSSVRRPALVPGRGSSPRVQLCWPPQAARASKLGRHTLDQRLYTCLLHSTNLPPPCMVAWPGRALHVFVPGIAARVMLA
jgi:hypothetical protein